MKQKLIFAILILTMLTCLAYGQTKSFPQILAEARTKTAAKDWVEAAKLWEEVVRINPVESKFWRQLAVVQYSAKDYKKAITAFEKLLELGGDVPPSTLYNIATCYALLDDKEQALKWLEKSFAEGYPNLERAQNDVNFKALKDDARFQKIVGLADTSKMSRDEGWRFDLALLAREVQRKGYNRLPRKYLFAAFEAEIKRLSDAVPTLTDMQISAELMKLLAKLGDGHTGVQGSRERPETYLSVPVKFYLFQEGLFITAADAKYKDLLGAQVLKYGERTVDEVLKSLDSLIGRDNEMRPKEFVPTLMRYLALPNALGLIPDAKKISLAIKDFEGKTRTVELAVDASAPDVGRVLPSNWMSFSQTLSQPVPHYLKNLNPNYWFEYLPESKTVYFQFNQVVNDKAETLAAFSERLFKFINENAVEKLVIDMRWNNGGNTFLTPPLQLGLIRNEKINQNGKLFIIIGRRTFSAAQNFITFCDRNTNTIFVGEPSGSSPNFIGEEVPFVLPYSRIQVNVSNLYWTGSSPYDYRTWIAPTLYTPPTFEMYKANRDSGMEAILNYLPVK